MDQMTMYNMKGVARSDEQTPALTAILSKKAVLAPLCDTCAKLAWFQTSELVPTSLIFFSNFQIAPRCELTDACFLDWKNKRFLTL